MIVGMLRHQREEIIWRHVATMTSFVCDVTLFPKTLLDIVLELIPTDVTAKLYKLCTAYIYS